MFGKAQLAPRRREGHAAIVLLVVLLASLIAYKTGPALRAIRTAQSLGQLKPRPYLVNSALSARPGVLWMESSAYFRIIWPALVFGILISAATDVTAYVESDFLGFQPPNANQTSNSDSFRLRLYFAHLKRGKFEVQGGQRGW